MKTICISYNPDDPDRTYFLREFEETNDSLKVHEVEINGTPISHFDRDEKGQLILMPQTPILKEVAVGEIFRQLANWNIQTRQNVLSWKSRDHAHDTSHM